MWGTLGELLFHSLEVITFLSFFMETKLFSTFNLCKINTIFVLIFISIIKSAIDSFRETFSTVKQLEFVIIIRGRKKECNSVVLGLLWKTFQTL